MKYFKIPIEAELKLKKIKELSEYFEKCKLKSTLKEEQEIIFGNKTLPDGKLSRISNLQEICLFYQKKYNPDFLNYSKDLLDSFINKVNLKIDTYYFSNKFEKQIQLRKTEEYIRSFENKNDIQKLIKILSDSFMVSDYKQKSNIDQIYVDIINTFLLKPDKQSDLYLNHLYLYQKNIHENLKELLSEDLRYHEITLLFWNLDDL